MYLFQEVLKIPGHILYISMLFTFEIKQIIDFIFILLLAGISGGKKEITERDLDPSTATITPEICF